MDEWKGLETCIGAYNDHSLHASIRMVHINTLMYFTIVCRVFVINQTQRLSNSQRKAASDKISNLSVSYRPNTNFIYVQYMYNKG